MTVTRGGLAMSTVTLKWLQVISALCAFGGPFIAVYVSTKVNEERTQGRFAANEARIGRTESDIKEVRERQDHTLERIDVRLQSIEQGLATLQGSLRQRGALNGPSSNALAWEMP